MHCLLKLFDKAKTCSYMILIGGKHVNKQCMCMDVLSKDVLGYFKEETT